jgi:hypothetical protein
VHTERITSVRSSHHPVRNALLFFFVFCLDESATSLCSVTMSMPYEHICEPHRQLGTDRDSFLRFFETHLTSLPTKAESVHTQRLFLLYLSVTACDLLCASWLLAHRRTAAGGGARDGRCSDIAAELCACYDTHTGGFHAVPCSGTSSSSSSSTLPLTPTDGVVATRCA